MIPRTGDILLDEDALAARARKASLYRAALALALMSALLAGLLLEDGAVAPDTENPAPALGMAVPARPDVTPKVVLAPMDISEKPRVESVTPVEPDSPPPADSPAVAVAEAGATGSPAAVEPAHAPDTPVAPAIAPANPETPKAAQKAAESAVTTAQPASSGAATAADVSAAPDGFRIQLGQFADLRGATTLRDTLLRQGYAAGLQVRVGVGPYAQRKAAESALAKMRRERGMGGLIVAPPSGKGLIVQLGVFAEQRNADELAARMKSWGYATQLHARVVVGPYSDQQSAQAALQKLQRERAMEGVLIMPAT